MILNEKDKTIVSDTAPAYIHYGSNHFDPSLFSPVKNYPPVLLLGDCISCGDYMFNGAGGDRALGRRDGRAFDNSDSYAPLDGACTDASKTGAPGNTLPALPKPADGTGLWGSVDADVYDAENHGSPDRGTINYSWRDWCKDNHYNPGHLKHFFRFKLKPGSNVLALRNQADLIPLPKLKPWHPKDDSWIYNLPPGKTSTLDQLRKLYSKNPCYLDYERLAGDGVDAIELRHSIRFRDCLDGWDCDCIFVMNRRL